MHIYEQTEYKKIKILSYEKKAADQNLDNHFFFISSIIRVFTTTYSDVSFVTGCVWKLFVVEPFRKSSITDNTNTVTISIFNCK